MRWKIILKKIRKIDSLCGLKKDGNFGGGVVKSIIDIVLRMEL